MRKVLVFGAAGFIGNAVARQLLQQNVEVIAVTMKNALKSEEAFRLKNLKCKIYECNLQDVQELPNIIEEREFDAFYQFAWDGTDREAIVDYNRQICNIRWVIQSIEAAKVLGCKKYIGAGSITQKELLYKEGRAIVDDRHKYFRAALVAGENMGRAYSAQVGIDFIWPLIINVYGEGEIASRLVNTTILKMLHGEKPVFSSGEQLYDFLHIEDAARAFILIGEKGRAGTEYVVGSGKPKALKEYLLELRDVVDSEMEMSFGEMKSEGFKLQKDMLDITELMNDTGFVPQVTFPEGIRRTMEWIRERE